MAIEGLVELPEGSRPPAAAVKAAPADRVALAAAVANGGAKVAPCPGGLGGWGGGGGKRCAVLGDTDSDLLLGDGVLSSGACGGDKDEGEEGECKAD